MIILRKMQLVLLAVVIGLAAVFISLGLLGMTSSVLAQGQERSGPKKVAPLAQPPSDYFFVGVVFTDPAVIEITNLGIGGAGEGTHTGRVRCNRARCGQKTVVRFTNPSSDAVYEYQFKTRQVLDLDPPERLVVAGRGTVSSGGQKARFSFTATFQNNGDGTASVTYVASRPDASFVIPKSAGTFRIFTGP